MARTLDPNGVVDDFVARIIAAKTRSDVAYAAVPKGTQDRLARQRGLVSDLAFRIGGEWELFQHRWHIAVISKESGAFVAGLQSKLDRAIADLPGRGLVPGLGGFRPKYPSRLRGDQIEALLDGDGYNITFTTLSDWRRDAGRHFTQPYAGRVARLVGETPEDACVLELVKAARNFIAHRSAKSRAALNQCIAPRADAAVGPGLTGTVNAGLARGTTKSVRDVGVYLQGRAAVGSPRRITVLTQRLEAVALTLKA